MDIWPDGKSGPLKAAKRKALKRPPLTFDAKQALSAASEGFWKVVHEIDSLKEPSLKSFACLRRREKGLWYAVVETTRWNWDHSEGEITATYFQQCSGKKEALKAARALLARHAETFAEDCSVEASIVVDLEWRNPRYGVAIEMVDGKEVRR